MSVNSTQVSYVVISESQNKHHLFDQGTYLIEEAPLMLQKLKHSFDFPCYLALPHQFIMTKNLFFSENFKENDIRNLLSLNADHYFSSPQESIYFDFEFMNDSKRNVRVIASKKDYIQNWKNIFLQAGMVIKVLSIDIIAAERFLSHCQLIDEKTVYAVFIINGFELLQVVIVNGCSFFKQSSILLKKNSDLILQEMIKFFRLYEVNKSYTYPINYVILLGIEQQEQVEIEKKIKFPVVDCKLVLKRFNQSIQYLLPLGMALKC